MPMQPPPPPSITPRQMNLLRIVAAMAWSDGHLASEEVDVMLDKFSSLFSQDAAQQHSLQQELKDYLTQNIPLEELVPKLESPEERELVLQLGYEVIQSSSRTPEEAKINVEEAAAYQKLTSLLDLPPETIERLEAQAIKEANTEEEMVDSLSRQLQEFMQGD